MDLGQEEPAVGSQGSSSGPKKKGSYLRALTTLQTAAAPPWELHGLQARVGRRIKHYARCGSPSPSRAPFSASLWPCLPHYGNMTCRYTSIDFSVAPARLT